MILTPDGRPAEAPADIVAPDGTPVTSEPPRQATHADLQALLAEMGAMDARLSAHHPCVPLLRKAAWWMTNLAQQVVAQNAHLVALQAVQPPAPPADPPQRDWRGLRLVDGAEEGNAS